AERRPRPSLASGCGTRILATRLERTPLVVAARRAAIAERRPRPALASRSRTRIVATRFERTALVVAARAFAARRGAVAE
ncbi:hypothetical protein, partial [Caballeronia glathei]|uniref:hypothetical protein n=1 Tax=Caballeronia glathei TaxID=60547 RepID=UPI0019D396B5